MTRPKKATAPSTASVTKQRLKTQQQPQRKRTGWPHPAHNSRRDAPTQSHSNSSRGDCHHGEVKQVKVDHWNKDIWAGRICSTKKTPSQTTWKTWASFKGEKLAKRALKGLMKLASQSFIHPVMSRQYWSSWVGRVSWRSILSVDIESKQNTQFQHPNWQTGT